MRKTRNPIAVLILCSMLLLAACGSDNSETSAAGADPADASDRTADSEEPGDTGDGDGSEAKSSEADSSEPPPVTLTRGDTTISIDAWAYCWTAPGTEDGICADGAPPVNLETLTEQGPIALTFPSDFVFLAVIYDTGYENELGEASVVATGDGWEIDPGVDGPAVLEIFGNGPEGDVIVSVAIG